MALFSLSLFSPSFFSLSLFTLFTARNVSPPYSPIVLRVRNVRKIPYLCKLFTSGFYIIFLHLSHKIFDRQCRFATGQRSQIVVYFQKTAVDGRRSTDGGRRSATSLSSFLSLFIYLSFHFSLFSFLSFHFSLFSFLSLSFLSLHCPKFV